MPDILETVIQEALVNLVRRVQWGLSREELERQASQFNDEASFERGMADNHETANNLIWKSDLCDFAAQVRFPREGDLAPARMRRRIKLALRDMCDGIEDEWTPQLSAIIGSINQTLTNRGMTFDDIEPFVFAERQLEEDRELERQAEFWKGLEPEDRKEARQERAERFARRLTWDEVRSLVIEFRRELVQETPAIESDRDANNEPAGPKF
ncbi:hypothetical protein E0J20_09175 [Rhizobium leguminosarum bv. viciae]|nr:hypothetical protein E0J20_09175 [Rhizobium leguminosarum bv. viciae]